LSTRAGSTFAGSTSLSMATCPTARSSLAVTPGPSTECASHDSGRVWVAAHDGLHCFDPDGTLLGKLRLPEIVSNLTFGGPKRNVLFVTASTSVYALRVNFNGVRSAYRNREGHQ